MLPGFAERFIFGQISADAAALAMRSLTGGDTVVLIAGPAIPVMRIAAATCSTAQQRRAPDSMSSAPSSRPPVTIRIPGDFEQENRRARTVCPHALAQDEAEEPNRNLPRCSATGGFPWPDLRTIKGVPPNACAWPTMPWTRQTRPCSSKWLKPGSSLPSRRKPEAATKIRNRPQPRERPHVALPDPLPPQ